MFTNLVVSYMVPSLLLLLLEVVSFQNSNFNHYISTTSLSGSSRQTQPQLRAADDSLSGENHWKPLSPRDRNRQSTSSSIKHCLSLLFTATSVLCNKKEAFAVSFSTSSLDCDDAIVYLRGNDGKDVVIIGTAHVSTASAELVRKTIRSLKPSVVMVELDPKRVGRLGTTKEEFEAKGFLLPSATSLSLNSPTSPSPTDTREKSNIFSGIIENFLRTMQRWMVDVSSKAVGAALGQFYKSIEKLGLEAGGEFKAAVEEGRKLNSKILLGDRDVDITLNRLTVALSQTPPSAIEAVEARLEKIELEKGMMTGNADSADIFKDKQKLEELVEQMKRKDVVSSLIDAVKEEMPLVYSAMIKERDEFMANAILEAAVPDQCLVCVCGGAHVAGMVAFLEKNNFKTVRYC